MTILQTIAELERKGKPVALATVVRSQGSVPRHAASKMLIYPDGHIDGTIGGGDMEARVVQEALAALNDGETRVLSYAFRDVQKGDVGVCGGEVEVFVEPLLPKPQVIIAGGGHVGKAVAHLAHWLGFHVVVTDDRAEFVTPEAIPSADEHIHCALSELPSRARVTPQTYILLTTRGMPIDVEGLPALLETSAAYIGVIGSRRRWEVCVGKLQANGMSDGDIGRITSPIGIELNAESPEEIAVSIMAEIIMLQRKGTGERMQTR